MKNLHTAPVTRHETGSHIHGTAPPMRPEPHSLRVPGTARKAAEGNREPSIL